MDTKETLFSLSRTAGPSGAENAAARLAEELLRPLCDEVKTDPLGNVLGFIGCKKTRNPPGKKPLVMLDAHLDEVGIMVTTEQDGFYTFRSVGSIDPRILPACEFTLLTEPVTHAVVACLPPHVMKAGDADKPQEITELYLDTGGVPVPVGTFGVFARQPFAMGALVSGKALDNRACFAALLRALELIERDKLNVDIAVCGSAQEERGGNGAITAAFGLQPDMALVADVTYGSAPDTSAPDAFKPGSGVCVNLGPDCSRAITKKLIELAKAKDIPYQTEVTAGMSRTNATGIQITRAGVATAVLSVPLRYMHTPAETLHTEDIESCAKLIGEWVMSL